MSKAKTDNSSLRTKVILRLLRTPLEEKLRVLDVYHGTGAIWHNVNLHYQGKIQVDGLDIEDKNSFALIGDNEKVLPVLDMSKYDVIDVDAYGVPFTVLREIFTASDVDALIFYTFCQTHLRMMPKGLLAEIGISESMFDKCPSFVSKHGHDKFLSWLALYGIEHVEYISLKGASVHVYGCFRYKSKLPESRV